jgi:hypothetical protein
MLACGDVGLLTRHSTGQSKTGQHCRLRVCYGVLIVEMPQPLSIGAFVTSRRSLGNRCTVSTNGASLLPINSRPKHSLTSYRLQAVYTEEHTRRDFATFTPPVIDISEVTSTGRVPSTDIIQQVSYSFSLGTCAKRFAGEQVWYEAGGYEAVNTITCLSHT